MAQLITGKTLMRATALSLLFPIALLAEMPMCLATNGLEKQVNQSHLYPPESVIAGSFMGTVPSIKAKTVLREATREEAERLGDLVMKFYNQDTDNPHDSKEELSAVRNEMIRLQKNGVHVMIDVLKMDDHELRAAIYKSLEVKVAGNSFTNTIHALLVCIGMIMCHYGGPGASDYPELNEEVRRHQLSGH